MELNKVYQGDCIEVLKTFPDEFVDCIVTSPPYWAVRDYGKDKQIGLEEHPQEFINKIVDVMRGCKRVLKPSGTIWLNLGDSFYTKSGSGQGSNYLKRHNQLSEGRDTLKKAHTETRGKFKSNWLQSKQRLLIPYRIAIAMQDELGLILRNDITWVKQYINWKTKISAGVTMPTSVQDRLNTNTESIFFFAKNPKYYFNLDAIRVPHTSSEKRPQGIVREREFGYDTKYEGVRIFKKGTKGYEKLMENEIRHGKRSENDNEDIVMYYNPKGKNPGDCIMFPLEPSSENHFAMFPKTLPDFCIKAGCPEGGVVLDPLAGGGNTLYVAKRLDRKYVGIELNEKYVALINKKLEQENITGFFETLLTQPSVEGDIIHANRENSKKEFSPNSNPSDLNSRGILRIPARAFPYGKVG